MAEHFEAFDDGLPSAIEWPGDTFGQSLNEDKPMSTARSLPDELEFMGWFHRGDDILEYTSSNHHTAYICGVNRHVIECNRPAFTTLLALHDDPAVICVPLLSHQTAVPFLRYLYTNSYALRYLDEDPYPDAPTSLLLHCQMFHVADRNQLSDLKTQAYVNILRQCEFGCCSPDKPIDFHDAVEYVYQHLYGHDLIRDVIVNYCVTRFHDHDLRHDAEFNRVVLDQPMFHRDLCRNSMLRGFENAETAMAIMQLPYQTFAPVSEQHQSDLVVAAIPFRNSKPTHDDPSHESITNTATLPLRPKASLPTGADDTNAALHDDLDPFQSNLFEVQLPQKEKDIDPNPFISAIETERLPIASETASLTGSEEWITVPLSPSDFDTESDWSML